MTVEEFLDWAERQPGRFELHDGQAVAMSPERVGHAEIKGRVYRILGDAILQAGLSCHALPDGAAVRKSEANCYEPDALVYCGPDAPRDAIEIANPLIVVEVLSPSTAHIDVARKLAGYFQISSVSHYLIIDPDRPPAIHHQRQGDGSILTRLVPSGQIWLDPPGLTIDVEAHYSFQQQ
jgi:Uma2 family endonuclease